MVGGDDEKGRERRGRGRRREKEMRKCEDRRDG